MQRRAVTDCEHIFVLSPPECLYVFPCQWNYRPDHCMYGSNCKGAELEGVSVLHGNRGVYHDDKQPTFKALYEAIRDVSVFLLSFSRHVLTSTKQYGYFGHNVLQRLDNFPQAPSYISFPQTQSLYFSIHKCPLILYFIHSLLNISK